MASLEFLKNRLLYLLYHDDIVKVFKNIGGKNLLKIIKLLIVKKIKLRVALIRSTKQTDSCRFVSKLIYLYFFMYLYVSSFLLALVICHIMPICFYQLNCM